MSVLDELLTQRRFLDQQYQAQFQKAQDQLQKCQKGLDDGSVQCYNPRGYSHQQLIEILISDAHQHLEELSQTYQKEVGKVNAKLKQAWAQEKQVRLS